METTSVSSQLKRERAKWVSLLSITTLVAFFLGLYTSAFLHIGGANLTDDPELARLIEAYELMKDEWYFGTEIDDLESDLVNRAINGMASYTVDPFTRFVLPENSGGTSTGTGMGVRISNYGQYFIIVDVFNNSPADEVGLESGDILLSINNQTLVGITWEQLGAIVGASDILSLTYLRDGIEYTVSITKDTYTATTAFGTYLGQQIGWLRVTNFDTYTPNETEVILENFADLGVEQLVIDLRDNGGGGLDSLIKMADFFLPIGDIIMEIREKGQTEGSFEFARTAEQYQYDNIIILINGDSASASEVFAAALNDNLPTVTLAGLQSYGKGTAQQVIPLNDGSTLRVTYAKWYTPEGISIHGVGVTPEVEVDDNGSYELDLSVTANQELWLTSLGYTGTLEEQWQAFQTDYDLSITGQLDQATSYQVAMINYDDQIAARNEQLWTAVTEITGILP